MLNNVYLGTNRDGCQYNKRYLNNPREDNKGQKKKHKKKHGLDEIIGEENLVFEKQK